MGAQRRMAAVKGAVLSLLLDAYQRRDRVALISFRGSGAQVLLPPTGSVDLAQLCLQEMPTGGRTPLGQGLLKALELVEAETIKDRDVLPLIVLLSDGRANVGFSPEGPGARPKQPGLEPGGGFQDLREVQAVASLVDAQRVPSVVIDTELGFIRLGLARPIAEAMGGRYLQLEDLQADSLARIVQQELPGLSPTRSAWGSGLIIPSPIHFISPTAARYEPGQDWGYPPISPAAEKRRRLFIRVVYIGRGNW